MTCVTCMTGMTCRDMKLVRTNWRLHSACISVCMCVCMCVCARAVCVGARPYVRATSGYQYSVEFRFMCVSMAV